MTQKKSIIHIGLYKTGSSTLQYTLSDLHDDLRRQGFFYPVGYLPHKVQHSDVAHYLQNGETQKFTRFLEDIFGDFFRIEQAQLILSGEAFSTLTGAQVEVLHDGLGRAERDFHVVLYIRNLYRYAISAIAQASRSGQYIAYPTRVLRRIRGLNPALLLSTWETVFGADNVHVFCLEALRTYRGIVQHFAQFAGFRIQPDVTITERNQSVDPIASALMSHLGYEFGVPNQFLYKAYFQLNAGRAVVERTEQHLSALVAPWVKQVNLSHPKLEPFRDLLVKVPDFSGALDAKGGPKYLKMLSHVLARTAKQLERLEQKQVSGDQEGGSR